MPDYVPGQRYPMSMPDALTVMRHGWPAVRGTPDLSRGRTFIKAPCEWEFWTYDGRKVSFSYSAHGCLVAQSREPDPQRPAPLS